MAPAVPSREEVETAKAAEAKDKLNKEEVSSFWMCFSDEPVQRLLCLMSKDSLTLRLPQRLGESG